MTVNQHYNINNTQQLTNPNTPLTISYNYEMMQTNTNYQTYDQNSYTNSNRIKINNQCQLKPTDTQKIRSMQFMKQKRIKTYK